MSHSELTTLLYYVLIKNINLVGKGGGSSSTIFRFFVGEPWRSSRPPNPDPVPVPAASVSISDISDLTSVLSSPAVDPEPSWDNVVELSATGRGLDTPIRTLPLGAPFRACNKKGHSSKIEDTVGIQITYIFCGTLKFLMDSNFECSEFQPQLYLLTSKDALH